ncbi:hypothetical protein ACS0TY_005192 [Phlomoides rotata]
MEQILKLAGERFIHFSSQDFFNTGTFTRPDLSVEDKQDVELAQLLLAAAEEVGNQQLERAMRLLENCQWISSNVGTPVQRAVFYFSEALRERINDEKGSSNTKQGHIDTCVTRNVDALIAMHRGLPFCQVLHFTAVQTILENINSATRIHLIDYSILSGLHWAAFMQAISTQKRDQNSYLKITAIETDKNKAEKIGNVLKSFASYLNLSFSYNLLFLSDIKDLKQDDLGIGPEETVAFLFPAMLKSLISKPACLKNLMDITQKIQASIIVVTEVEANLNSPSFFTRFIDTLFYFGALFDSLDESIAGDDRNRMVIEAGTYRNAIHNIVATEGYQRLSRSVTMNVCRAFFTRFGMQELELSTASLYQAPLIVNQFPSGKSCTLDISTKCLLVGWKGTPLFSISA